MTICPDLWYSILSYIPRSDLRDFSRASPIFQQMVCNVGIRMFYDDRRSLVIDIAADDIMIIVLSSGKKHVIKDYDQYYEHLSGGRDNNSNSIIINKGHIEWITRPDPNKYYVTDSKNGVAMCFEHSGCWSFTSLWAVRGFKKLEDALEMKHEITGKIDYIDISRYRAVGFSYIWDGYVDKTAVELEDFIICYRGGLWVDQRPIIGI